MVASGLWSKLANNYQKKHVAKKIKRGCKTFDYINYYYKNKNIKIR